MSAERKYCFFRHGRGHLTVSNYGFEKKESELNSEELETLANAVIERIESLPKTSIKLIYDYLHKQQHTPQKPTLLDHEREGGC